MSVVLRSKQAESRSTYSNYSDKTAFARSTPRVSAFWRGFPSQGSGFRINSAGQLLAVPISPAYTLRGISPGWTETTPDDCPSCCLSYREMIRLGSSTAWRRDEIGGGCRTVPENHGF